MSRETWWVPKIERRPDGSLRVTRVPIEGPLVALRSEPAATMKVPA